MNEFNCSIVNLVTNVCDESLVSWPVLFLKINEHTVIDEVAS